MPADIDGEENLMATDRPTGGANEPSSNAGGQNLMPRQVSRRHRALQMPPRGRWRYGQVSQHHRPLKSEQRFVVDEEAGQGGTLGDSVIRRLVRQASLRSITRKALRIRSGKRSQIRGPRRYHLRLRSNTAPYPGVMTWLLPLASCFCACADNANVLIVHNNPRSRLGTSAAHTSMDQCVHDIDMGI